MSSAVDGWIAAVLIGTALIGLWATIYATALGGLIGWLIAVPAVLIPATILPLWMLWHTVYRLESEHLVAVSGPFRWRVAYRNIRSVKRRRELISGPALSLDRLVIEYAPMGWLIISPRDPEAFTRALHERLHRSG
ncbi:MAG: PH domain-containing protein [Wenzhouxiangella sp.]